MLGNFCNSVLVEWFECDGGREVVTAEMAFESDDGMGVLRFVYFAEAEGGEEAQVWFVLTDEEVEKIKGGLVCPVQIVKKNEGGLGRC